MTAPSRARVLRLPVAPPERPAMPGVGGLRDALRAGQLDARQARAIDALLGVLLEGEASESEPATSPAAGPSNDELIERYLRSSESRGWRPATTRIRESQLRLIAAALPVPLAHATEEDLLAWREGLQGKPETIASYTSAARGLYRWMSVRARPRIRHDDPALILDRPRIPEASPRPIASDQYDLALACAVSQPEMYVWLGLMGCSGLRCCEIAWMRGPDVELRDDGTGLLHIEGKGGKRRTVPAGRILMRVLLPYAERAGLGPVFTRASDGATYTPHDVSRRVARFLRQLKIPATAHQLRHRWAGDYHALDPDLFRQAKLMGHASVETTQRYTEISPDEAAGFVEDLTQRRLGRQRRPQRR